MIFIHPQTWIVWVEVEPRRHTLPCCATETLIIYSACEGWRVGWRERKMEREIWREMWSRMAHSVSLPSSFFFSLSSSQLIYNSENHRLPCLLFFSAPRLLLLFFSLSLLPICDESHALPPSNLPQLPHCLLSSPLLSSPILSWHRQIARLGWDNRHYRASLVRGGRRRSCFVVMERGSSGMRPLQQQWAIVFLSSSTSSPPTSCFGHAPPHLIYNMRLPFCSSVIAHHVCSTVQ